MNMVWINRIGIILDFLAAFMIAPELIGEERLRHWEEAIENRLRGTIQSLQRRTNRYKAAADSQKASLHLLAKNPEESKDTFEPFIPTGCAGWIMFFILGIITWLILSISLIPKIVRGEHPLILKLKSNGSSWGRWFATIFLHGVIGTMVLLLASGILGMNFSDFLSVVFERVSRPFMALLRGLTGDRLRKTLVAIGIVFLILGYGLQLLATF